MSREQQAMTRLLRSLLPSLGCASALLLGGCASSNYRPVSDSPVRIGKPYSVKGVTYTPSAQPGYDMLGYASWYGSESGHQTANGERFRPKWITAAHTSLPLPSYVEVTALDSGRTILVRVNDRGPFAAGRIIDLSHGAARQIGMVRQGSAPVRVRLAEPSEAEKARLRRGKEAIERPRAGQADLARLRARLAAGTR
jgi:rare lipoprotein A